jgi:hypothetical protein
MVEKNIGEAKKLLLPVGFVLIGAIVAIFIVTNSRKQVVDYSMDKLGKSPELIKKEIELTQKISEYDNIENVFVKLDGDDNIIKSVAVVIEQKEIISETEQKKLLDLISKNVDVDSSSIFLKIVNGSFEEDL